MAAAGHRSAERDSMSIRETDALGYVSAGLEEAQVVANDLKALHEVATLMQWHRGHCARRDVAWVRLERNRGMSFSATCLMRYEEEGGGLPIEDVPPLFVVVAPTS